MLFILNTQGVPSIAKVIQVTASASMTREAAARVQAEVFSASHDASDRGPLPGRLRAAGRGAQGQRTAPRSSSALAAPVHMALAHAGVAPTRPSSH